MCVHMLECVDEDVCGVGMCVCVNKSETRGNRKTFAYERTLHRKPKRYQVP